MPGSGRRHGGQIWVYHEDDLKQIMSARESPAVYTDSEGTWLFASEVAKRFGFPVYNLWHYREKSWPCLTGGKLRAKQVAARYHPRPKNPRSDRVLLWVYHEDDLARLAAWFSGEALEAAAAYEVEAKPSPATTPRRRGRPKGWRDQEAIERDQRLVEDAKTGAYASIADLARKHDVDRSHASKVLKKAGIKVKS
jgi:hypothetical protein